MFEFIKRITKNIKSFMTRRPKDTPWIFRGYSAAQNTELTVGWLAEQKTIHDILRNDLDRLRDRARELTKNSDYVVRYRTVLENNIIGPQGIRMQSRATNTKGQYDEKLANFIEKEFKNWCDNYCDYSGFQNFTELCKSLIGSMPADGEFLINMIREPKVNIYGFALQRIDVSAIDTQKNTTPGQGYPEIINGIEINSAWQRVAVHLKPRMVESAFKEVVRLPSKDILHVFKQHEANQMRGVPWLASSMIGLHNLHGYMMAALMAAQLGANQFGFITNNFSSAIEEEEQANKPQVKLPGSYDVLPMGSEFKQVDSQYPDENFNDFVKTTLKRISSGLGISYTSLSNDLEAVNYSSMRSGLLLERDNFMNIQSWFISAFVNKIFQEWLKSAHFNGIFSKILLNNNHKNNLHIMMPIEWQSRRWDWVDPKNDAEAKLKLAQAGVLPPDALAASMGYDYLNNLEKIAKSKEYAEKLGLNISIFSNSKDNNKNEKI